MVRENIHSGMMLPEISSHIFVNLDRGSAHNEKAFDSQFILNRAIQMKWKPELILNGLKIVSMKIEHMLFIDSVS